MKSFFTRNSESGRTKDGVMYKPECIVLHITQGTSESAMRWFADPLSQASSHWIVDEGGEWIQVVREEDTAWHAGRVIRSTWNGLKYKDGVHINPNLYSVGIEIALLSPTQFPSVKQWLSVARLVKDIRSRYGNLPLVNHNEINAVKTCPGMWMDKRWIELLTKYV